MNTMQWDPYENATEATWQEIVEAISRENFKDAGYVPWDASQNIEYEVLVIRTQKQAYLLAYKDEGLLLTNHTAEDIRDEPKVFQIITELILHAAGLKPTPGQSN